jgi:hypothetical protein
MASMHKNDIGTTIELTLKLGNVRVDLTTQTTMEIFFRNPAGVVTTETAVWSDDGSDGRMEYVSTTGDFDVVGTWAGQGHIVTTNPAGEWKTGWFQFSVLEVLA